MDYETVSAEDFGASLKGLGLNILVAGVLGFVLSWVYKTSGTLRQPDVVLLPDVVPVVDHVPQLPGLIVATGMCGHGFGIGPAFGRIAVPLAHGTDPGHDLSRFGLSRFSDGSKLVTGPNL